MRILIAGLAMALLAGCSSVAEIRATPAVLSLSSPKQAKAVAECIRDGWQATSIVGGSVGGILQQSGEGFSVIAPNSESPWHVADVSPAAGGSIVRYHFYRTWQSPSNQVIRVVSDCTK
ncbi:hypothetical protein K1T36_20740 [Pseudomonas protegens]|uniref:hypothetical protein n=1 Tax=Pseudomonas protegens TaxID=380021 RepID=UPI001C6A76A9|nr:hypothetical protein [Pseudomonas protegens]QYM99497.1 hypothetical protein K1T36_20740 [Pseudomonas protegens]